MRRLVCAFVVRKLPKTGFLVLWPIYVILSAEVKTLYQRQKQYVYPSRFLPWFTRATCICIHSIISTSPWTIESGIFTTRVCVQMKQKSGVLSALLIFANFYIPVLSWLKEHPPLTEEQLKDLFISLDDFKV